MRVYIYFQRKNKRSESVTASLQAGISDRSGDKVFWEDEAHYTGPLQTADIVCFYGLSGNLMRIFQDYRRLGTQTVFIDLGVWGRKGEKFPDYHRIAIDAYQPTNYFDCHATTERFLVHERHILPWTYKGDEILVAGMSERASQVWGLGSTSDHAMRIIATLRQYTDRPIAYRPKPSCPNSGPIMGTRFAKGSLADELKNVWAVVTYRSHLAVDALLAGIPCFVLGDHPAFLMSHQGHEQRDVWGITTLHPNDLTQIETPLYPSDAERLQFMSNLAWHQYSLREMRSGYMWRELKKHGWIRS